MSDLGGIIGAMRGLSAKYAIQFGKAPLGYVMGIKDYRAFRLEMGHMLVTQGRGGSDVRQLDGLSIYLKISSGIELLVHEECAQRILAEVEAKNPQAVGDLIRGGIIR